MKIQKAKLGGGSGRGGLVWSGWMGWVGSGWGCVRGGGQGSCEQRIEVFVKIKKKIRVGSGRGRGEGRGVGLGGVRVDINREVKFL